MKLSKDWKHFVHQSLFDYEELMSAQENKEDSPQSDLDKNLKKALDYNPKE